MPTKFLPPKALFVFGLTLVVIGMAIALYQQFFKGLEPCALCVFQRLAYISYMLIAFVAIVHNPRRWGARIYAFLQLPVLVTGLAIALRQIWLQNLPLNEVPACGPGINYLLQEFSLQKVAATVWAGSSDCAVVTWRFLTLSMASWSALLFTFLALLSLYIMLKAYPTK